MLVIQAPAQTPLQGETRHRHQGQVATVEKRPDSTVTRSTQEQGTAPDASSAGWGRTFCPHSCCYCARSAQDLHASFPHRTHARPRPPSPQAGWAAELHGLQPQAWREGVAPAMLSTLGPRCTGTGVACPVRDTSQEPGRGEGGLLGVRLRLGVGAGQASQRGLHSCTALCLGPRCGLPALLSG